MVAKKRLARIAPLQSGIVLGILYGLFGLIAVPFLLLVTFLTGEGATSGSIVFAVMLPLGYAVGGFGGGIIAAALYNLVAGWTGGLEVEFADAIQVSEMRVKNGGIS